MTSTYNQRLQQRLDSMDDAWKLWLDGQVDSREVLVINCHQLSGSAALYGYAEMGEVANHLHASIMQEAAFSEVKEAWLKLRDMLVSIIRD